jgi:hypothetical protein
MAWGRSLSIGSPLLNTIREGACQSSLAASSLGMTDRVTSALSALAPRLLEGHSTLLFGSDVTVRVFSYPEIPDAFVVRTTCSILGGQGPSRQLTEFSRVSGCLLSPLLAGFPVKQVGSLAREFTVWISPLTLARGAKRKHGRSSGGLPVSLSRG